MKDSVCSASRCGGVILADTEDWKKPLCHYHYQKRCFEAMDAMKNISEPMKFMEAVRELEDLAEGDDGLMETLEKLNAARQGAPNEK